MKNEKRRRPKQNKRKSEKVKENEINASKCKKIQEKWRQEGRAYLRKKYGKSIGERMKELVDSMYEFQTIHVNEFQDIWKFYNRLCDDVEIDFLEKT